jgi:hypothetical protein
MKNIILYYSVLLIYYLGLTNLSAKDIKEWKQIYRERNK